MCAHIKKILLVGLLVKYSVKKKFFSSDLQLSKFRLSCYTSSTFTFSSFFAIHRAYSHSDFNRAGLVLGVGEETFKFRLGLNVLVSLNLVLPAIDLRFKRHVH